MLAIGAVSPRPACANNGEICVHDTRLYPDTCDNSCVYKRFSQNMRNASAHDEAVKAEERERLLNAFSQKFRSAYLFFDDVKFDETIESLREGEP
jgi:hypothetical protein